MSVHARRRAALEACLLDLAPIWMPSPFCEARPAWCAAHPELAEALLALDDATLAILSTDAAAAHAFLLPHLPALAPLPALIDLPHREVALVPAPERKAA